MHERLELTTMSGNVVQLLSRLPGTRLREAIRGASTQVHEEFATWMSCVPTGWTGDRVRGVFPAYERHLHNAQSRVAALTNPYAALHAVQAVARSAMQSAELAELTRRPLTGLRPADLPRSMRPDWRLRRLERAPAEHGWGPLAAYAGPAHDLSAEWFAPGQEEAWGADNRIAYDWCAELLNRSGCPTLPYDGHVPYSQQAQAEQLSPLDERRPIPPSRPADQALFAVESETQVFGPAIPLRVRPPGTWLDEMRSGNQARAHLFLAIRPGARVAMQYQVLEGSVPDWPHVALLRCQTDEGVEMLDVTDRTPAELTDGRAVLTNISMRSLADRGVRERWAPLLGTGRASVLCDLRPSIHLRDWLADPELSLRYAVVGSETRVGWARTLVFRLEGAAGGRSRIHVAPVSRMYATALDLWLAEQPELAGRVVKDEGLADEPLLVRFTVAHVMLEEHVFDFHAGE